MTGNTGRPFPNLPSVNNISFNHALIVFPASERVVQYYQNILMAKTKQLSPKYQVWIDARKKYKLSNAHIQMARELGLNPKKLGRLANHKQEPWKAPLPVFIEHIYFKNFGKQPLKNAPSIEQMVKDKKQRQLECKKRKQEEKEKVNKTL